MRGFAFLNITSWRGISFNAMHYYGKLYIFERESDLGKEIVQNAKAMSHLGKEVAVPFSEADLVIEVTRILTKEQSIDIDEKDRLISGDSFAGMYEDWLRGNKATRRFDFIEDIIREAKKLLIEHQFSGTCKLLFEGEEGSMREPDGKQVKSKYCYI